MLFITFYYLRPCAEAQRDDDVYRLWLSQLYLQCWSGEDNYESVSFTFQVSGQNIFQRVEPIIVSLETKFSLFQPRWAAVSSCSVLYEEVIKLFRHLDPPEDSTPLTDKDTEMCLKCLWNH